MSLGLGAGHTNQLLTEKRESVLQAAVQSTNNFDRDPDFPSLLQPSNEATLRFWQEKSEMRAAKAVYMGARPFTMLREVYWKAFLCTIAFFNFIVPSAEDLSRRRIGCYYS
jgi:hypothetical protein